MARLRLLLDAVTDHPGRLSETLGEGFLDAYLSRGQRPDLHWLVRSRATFEALQRQAKRHGRTAHARSRIAESVGGDDHHTLLLNAAAATRHLWWRDTFGTQNVNLVMLCGSEPAEVLEQFVRDSLLAPLLPGDCLLCTSKAVMQELRTCYGHYTRYVATRFGSGKLAEPAIAHLPQGIDAARYAPAVAAGSGAKERWGLADDRLVVLAHGRGLREPNHRVALLRALATLGEAERARVHLMLVGTEALEPMRALAAAMALPITAGAVDGGADDAMGFAGADIALATPGTPSGFVLKAMACGVPVAGSDWGIYRELVTPDETGILVPVASFATGSGTDALVQGGQYGEPFGFHEASVDRAALVAPGPLGRALDALAANGERRAAMGAAGRARAARHDWPKVVQLFDRLLTELAGRHAQHAKADPAPFRVRRLNTWTAMRERGTQMLEPSCVLNGRGGETIDLATALLDQHPPADRSGSPPLRPVILALANIFTAIDNWRLDELRTLLPKSEVQDLLPALRWLIAAGIVEVVAAETDKDEDGDEAGGNEPQNAPKAEPAPAAGAA